MRVSKSLPLLTSLTLALFAMEPTVLAQGGGAPGGRGANNRPGGAGGQATRGGLITADQQAIQYRQILEIADATQWSLLLPLITDVISARNFLPNPVARGGRGAILSEGRPGGPGGGRGASLIDPDLSELEAAIARNAPTEELKAITDKANEAIKMKLDTLHKAQAELRKVLTVRQEAILLVNGLLLPAK